MCPTAVLNKYKKTVCSALLPRKFYLSKELEIVLPLFFWTERPTPCCQGSDSQVVRVCRTSLSRVPGECRYYVYFHKSLKNVNRIFTRRKSPIAYIPVSYAVGLSARFSVNTIAPGVTATDGLVLEQAQVDQMITQTPLGRLGQPADIADAVALIVSDNARWITGQHIRANGGIV